MKRNYRLLLSLSLIFCVRVAQSASDGSWSQAGGGSQDWGNAGNWVNSVVADGTDMSAIFNVNLTADQSVTNAGGRTVGHLVFQDTTITSPNGGYNLGAATDTGSLTLDVSSGRSVINVGTLDTANGKKVSQIVPIINADGILKIGTGQYSIRAASPGMTGDYVATAGLTDTRSSLASLTGMVVLGGAQFQVDFGNAAVNTVNLVGSAVPVTLGGSILVPNNFIPPTLPMSFNNLNAGGGILTVSGRASSINTQVVASVTLNRGSHTINVTTGTTSTNVFDPTTFTRNAGAVVNFNTLGSSSNILKAGGLANDGNGIIGGWAINGTNWAQVTAANTIGFLNTYNTSTDPTAWATADNASPSANPIAAIGTRTINTLRLTANNTNSIGAGNTLTLSDGGLLGTAGIHQFNDGTLKGPAGGELIIHESATNMMNAVIADNTSASTLIKSGGGILAFSGTNANTYSGGTYVNQGTLQIGDGLSGGNGGSLGSGPVTLYAGSLVVNKTNDMTLTNTISGAGLLTKAGSGTLTLNCLASQSGYNLSAPGSVSGNLGLAGTRLDAGTLALANDTSLGGVFRFNTAGGTLRSADATTRTITNWVDIAVNGTTFGSPGSGDLVFQGVVDNGGAAKTLTISNSVTRFDGQVRGTGTTAVGKNGPGTLVLGNTANVIVRPFSVTQGTLRISDEGCLGTNPGALNLGQLTLNGGALETTTTMAIDDSNRGITVGAAGGTFNVDSGTTLTLSTFNNISGGGGTLIKAGAGTLFLQPVNTYSGSTLINAGTLKLDTTASIASSPTIVVGAGATLDVSSFTPYTLAANQTLGGSGKVTGNVNGSGSSTISPGSSPGTLTFDNDLTLTTGDGLTFDLTNNTTIGSGINDLLVVNGNLTLSSNAVTIRPIAPGGALANGTYRLVNYTGTKTGFLSINAGTRYTFTLDEATVGQINLNVTGTAANLLWRGNLSTAWDIANSQNWRNGANPDAFFNFDTVSFDDTATSFNVAINDTVLPSSMTINANNAYTFTGPGGISGTTGITKGGNGAAILANSGTNDYTGATIVNAGTFQIGNNSGAALFGGSAISNNATLRFQNANNSLIVSNLSGPGSLFVEGNSGEVALSGINTFSGATTVGQNARLSVYGATNGSLASLGTTPGITVLSDGAFFTTVSGNYTQALTLSGDGFASETTGALRVGSNGAAWSGPIALASAASIGNDGTATLTISNAINGAAFALTKVGQGTLLLLGNNTYGNTVVENGPLQIGNGGTSGSLGSGTIQDDWYINVNRSDDVLITAPISGTGGFLKSGLNTVTLSGNNSYSGTFDGTATPLGTGAAGTVSTRLDGGTLAVGSDTACGTSILRFNNAAATFRSADANARTIGNLIDLAADVTLGSATSGNLIFTGEVNCGAAAKNLIISNSVTLLNGTVSGGDSANNQTKSGLGTLVLNGTATHNKPTVVNLGAFVVNGSINSTRAVTVAGGSLCGTGSISGPVTIQAAGTLSPGTNTSGASIGSLSINNTLTLGGTNLMEIDKTGGTYDRITGLTSVTYGGVLVVSNISGTYAGGDSFKLYDAGSYSGSFLLILPPTPGAGLTWDTSSLVIDGTLKVSAPTTPVPHFTSISRSGSTLSFSGTNGIPSHDYHVITSSNVLLSPLSSWTSVLTNQFDGSGNFNFTQPVTPATPGLFYQLRVPLP
jgi:autotransporter-associated beta strand protein